VDVQGAEALRQRILAQEQWHWRQAESVRDGRAPATDPDVDFLVSCEPGLRVYQQGSGRLLVKRLDEGWWSGLVEPRWEPPRLGLNHEPPTYKEWSRG
jgi:hypothetical protein